MENIALEFELVEVKKRFQDALAGLVILARRHASFAPVIKKLLTTTELFAAAGQMVQDFGYDLQWDDGPLSRMEFISHFLGHEILDDGDPAIGWCRWSTNRGNMFSCRETGELLVPDEEEDQEWAKYNTPHPFFHSNREALQAFLPDTPPLDEEGVLWVIDWNEKEEARKRTRFGEVSSKEYGEEKELGRGLIELASLF